MATSCLSEISVQGDRRLAEEEGAGKRDADSDSKGRFGILADLQVFVTNLSIRKDRKAHMERMLHALGLRNISFPPLIPAEMVDIFSLFSQSQLTTDGVARIRRDIAPAPVEPLIAVALSQVDRVEIRSLIFLRLRAGHEGTRGFDHDISILRH